MQGGGAIAGGAEGARRCMNIAYADACQQRMLTNAAAELNEAEGRTKAEERARAGAAADEEELTKEEEARLAAAALARMRARKAAKEEEAAKARERMEEEAAKAKAREDEDARRTQDAARDAELALARERASSLRPPRQRVDPPPAPTKSAGEGSDAGAREAEAGKKKNADCVSYYTAYERMCVVVFVLLHSCPRIILVLLCVLMQASCCGLYSSPSLVAVFIVALLERVDCTLCVLMQARCCGL